MLLVRPFCERTKHSLHFNGFLVIKIRLVSAESLGWCAIVYRGVFVEGPCIVRIRDGSGRVLRMGGRSAPRTESCTLSKDDSGDIAEPVHP